MFPPPPLAAAAIRRLDELAIEKYGVPGVCLMENAGLAVARAAESMFRGLGRPDAPVAIVCGKGNNGGDGFVAARHLEAWGLPIEVCFAAQRAEAPGEGDAAVHRLALERGGTPIRTLDGQLAAWTEVLKGSALIVDALLGTGLSGPPRGPVAQILQAVIDAGKPVLAVDLPSGLDADTGEVHGVCPRAQRTITFGALKLGFYRGQGPQRVGRVELYPIGIPAAAYLEVLQLLEIPPGPAV